MTIQRITRTHFAGLPLEQRNIEFATKDGTLYRLTHYEMEDAHITWLHGYREVNRVRFYTSRTPDEVTADSLQSVVSHA